MRNQEASTIASLLVDRVFSYFGTPLQILTDRGRNFESNLFEELCRRLGIDHIRTTSYKPSTNDLVERFHRTLNAMIAKVVCENQRDWDIHLPSVLAAYRATTHENTRYSPNFLFLGRENCAPLDLMIGGTPEIHDVLSPNDFVANHQTIMLNAYALVRDTLKRNANRQKQYYDMRVHARQFQVGDWVWLYSPRRRKGISPKWQKFYVGPFLIIGQIGAVNYRLQKSLRATPFIAHVDKLKRYIGEPWPSWEMQNQPSHLEAEDDGRSSIVCENRRPQRNRRPPTRYTLKKSVEKKVYRKCRINNTTLL